MGKGLTWNTGMHPYDGTGESRGQGKRTRGGLTWKDPALKDLDVYRNRERMSETEQDDGDPAGCQAGYDKKAKPAPSGKDDDLALFGHNLFGDPIRPETSGAMADRFTIPPFTVLNARQGEWQDRKAAWLSKGIQSEVGRGDVMPSGANSAYSGTSTWAGDRGPARAPTAAPGGAPRLAMKLGKDGHTVRGDGAGRPMMAFSPPEGDYDYPVAALQNASGTSIFDPVLTELMYRWFCPKGGLILDPFAGGSVRGIVAGCLGFKYHGIELRPEQVAANEAQRSIAPEASIVWQCGDSREALAEAPEADMLFTCPPYGDLEVYSDDKRDLSTMDYAAFCGAYREILVKSIARLRPNRFACIVIGEFRDPKTGLYRGFVPFTLAACVQAGLGYYNEAILVTAVGSLPIRTGKQFDAGRKMGKTHQNILLFVKGDWRKAMEAMQKAEGGKP